MKPFRGRISRIFPSRGTFLHELAGFGTKRAVRPPSLPAAVAGVGRRLDRIWGNPVRRSFLVDQVPGGTSTRQAPVPTVGCEIQDVSLVTDDSSPLVDAGILTIVAAQEVVGQSSKAPITLRHLRRDKPSISAAST